jgi:DNA-binding protein H-NS
MEKLIDIQSQIAKLESQATAIRAREFDSTVKEILAKMAAFGISLNDLKTKTKAKSGKTSMSPRAKGVAKAAKKASRTPAVVAAKYRGPGGESWSGRGLPPRWLKAQIALGRTKDEFLITP